jgi:hypothetical protein
MLSSNDGKLQTGMRDGQDGTLEGNFGSKGREKFPKMMPSGHS